MHAHIPLPLDTAVNESYLVLNFIEELEKGKTAATPFTVTVLPFVVHVVDQSDLFRAAALLSVVVHVVDEFSGTHLVAAYAVGAIKIAQVKKVNIFIVFSPVVYC